MPNYKDSRLIGSGGFGEVWLCARDTDGQMFAKKKLKSQEDKEAIRRFVREVRLLSSLDHPNIVRVIGVRLTREPYFYIMPLYKRSLFNELPSLIGDESRIQPIFEHCLDAIEYAHAQGVIHRDLKPQNVLMNTDADLVLSDFGLGRAIDAESTRQTLTGYGLGTPLYMAPEQVAEAKNADHRSDIYSLGRMLYELYTGPLTLGPQDYSSLPPAVAVIVNRCTQRDPDKRFQTVTDLKTAWRSVFDAEALASELDEVQSMIVQLSSATPIDKVLVKRFLECLAKRQDDTDLIHRAVMQVNPETFTLADPDDRDNVILIIDGFVEVAAGQGWAFEYTDKIGNRCRDLFKVIPDFEIRAELAWCTLEVGLDHNRWHVLDIAADMISSPKKPGEAIPLVEKLKSVQPEKRYRLLSRLDIGKLDPLLKPLFQFDERE